VGELIKGPKGGLSVPWRTGLNCYSFAAKCANPAGEGLVACVPGVKGGKPVTNKNIDKTRLFQACVADGFEDVSGGVIGSDYKMKNAPKAPPGKYLVAVFYDVLKSFHFARQLADGGANAAQWVHKPSAPQDAHNIMNRYYLGTDIGNVPWGPQFEFVGYLLAPTAGVMVHKGNFIA